MGLREGKGEGGKGGEKGEREAGILRHYGVDGR